MKIAIRFRLEVFAVGTPISDFDRCPKLYHHMSVSVRQGRNETIFSTVQIFEPVRILINIIQNLKFTKHLRTYEWGPSVRTI